MIVLRQGKVSFRLVCKETLNNSSFSSWFDEDSSFSSWFDEASLHGGPGMLRLDHEIVVCLGELEEYRRSGHSVRELLRREKEDGDHRP